MKKILSYIVLLLCIGAIIFCACLLIYARKPIDTAQNAAVLVDIPTGTSFIKVTEILGSAGLIEHKFLFYALVWIKRGTRSIRAGEYEFATSITPFEMIDKLVRGEIKTYRVTVHEDYTLREVAERLKEYKLIDEKVFFELAADTAFLSSMGVVGSSAEGYLFPDTYFLNRSMSTKQIIRMMVDRFWSKISPEMMNKAAARGLNPNEFVTLASLVGKESGNTPEKPMIAAVFYNRLKKGMPLQSDPTTVYDLKDFDGKVLRSHYRRKSPYNTYIIRGLPPGPIANPGLDSFQAVLNPADADYLYFVSQKDGTHFFSSSLDAHNSAVLRFRNMTDRD